MELKNDAGNVKIVFSKLDGKLCVVAEEEEYADSPCAYEVYKDIDFDEFKKNIEKIEDTEGYYTEGEE